MVVLPDHAYLRDELENLAHDIENFHGEATIVFTNGIEKTVSIETWTAASTTSIWTAPLFGGNSPHPPGGAA